MTTNSAMPPAADDPEDPVADLERPVDAGPERLDLAGVLQPGNVGRHPARRGVIAPGLHQVGPVQTRTPGPGPGPGLPAARVGHLADLRTSGPPGLVMTTAFIGRYFPWFQ